MKTTPNLLEKIDDGGRRGTGEEGRDLARITPALEDEDREVGSGGDDEIDQIIVDADLGPLERELEDANVRPVGKEMRDHGSSRRVGGEDDPPARPRDG